MKQKCFRHFYLAKLLRFTSEPPRTHCGVEVPFGTPGLAQLKGCSDETRSKCNSELLYVTPPLLLLLPDPPNTPALPLLAASPIIFLLIEKKKID